MSEVNTQDEDLDESKIPQKYFQFCSVFSKKNADTLPPHRPYDHKIPLSEGAQVPFGPVYSLSQVELKALHEYIKENLDKGLSIDLSPLLVPPSYLSRRKMAPCASVLITEA